MPGQFWKVFAFEQVTGDPVLNDAANITAKISLDNGPLQPLDDVNPTEVEDGYYIFSLTQAETNAQRLDIYPESTTLKTQVIGCGSTEYTDPSPAGGLLSGDNVFRVQVLDAEGDLELGGATVRLYRTGQAGSQPTGEDGWTTFNVVDATWDVLVTIDGYWPVADSVIVNSNLDKVYRLSARAVPPGAGEGLCNALFRVIDQHKRTVPGVRITAKLKSRQSFVGDAIVIDRQITDITDNNGEATLELIRGNQFVVGTGIYQIELKFGSKTYRYLYTVPDQSSAIATLQV